MGDFKVIKYGDPIKGFDDGSKAGVTELAINVAGQAIEFAPFDKGQLKGSIGYSVEGRNTASPPIKSAESDNVAYVGSGVEHATYQEFGTRRMKAQPFLRPAIDIEARGKSAEEVVKKWQLKSMKEATSRGIKSVKL